MTDPLDEILAQVQQDPGGRGLRTDPVDNLITATVGDFAKACRAVAELPAPRIVIVTGFTIPSVEPPCGETDGPLGALHLARCFAPAGIPVTLLTDGTTLLALRAGVEAAGMSQLVRVVELPVHQANYRTAVHALTGPFNVLIALERVGPSRDSRCYSMRGRDMTELTRPAHVLFEPPRNAISIGIGDGGNEIGMGKLPLETMSRNIRHGERMACRVRTDYLIVAGVSNWGAYALAAGVRLLRRLPCDPTLYDLDRERELLQIMIDAGPLVDGVTGQRSVTVDGLDFDDYASVFRAIGSVAAASQ